MRGAIYGLSRPKMVAASMSLGTSAKFVVKEGSKVIIGGVVGAMSTIKAAGCSGKHLPGARQGQDPFGKTTRAEREGDASVK